MNREHLEHSQRERWHAREDGWRHDADAAALGGCTHPLAYRIVRPDPLPSHCNLCGAELVNGQIPGVTARLLLQFGDRSPVEVTHFQPKPGEAFMDGGATRLYRYPDKPDLLALRVDAALTVEAKAWQDEHPNLNPTEGPNDAPSNEPTQGR